MDEKVLQDVSIQVCTDEDENPQYNTRKTIEINLFIIKFETSASSIFGTLILSLLYAHFIWATWYYIEKTDDILDATTCTGYGFWMILFILLNFGLCYKLVLKRWVLPHFNRYLWKPYIERFRTIRYAQSILLLIILTAILAFVVVDNIDDPWKLMPLAGLVIYVFIGFLISPFKKQIPWNTVLSGIIAQFVLGLVMIRWDVGRNTFTCVGDKVNTFLHYAVNASAFVYGEDLVYTQAVVAFSAFSAIYLMSVSINILYYYEIIQSIILNLGILLQWLLGTPICESVVSAANIFLGMSESPFFVKPYLQHLTDSEIHSVMTSGFAAVSGTVLAAYISFGARPADLITACVMSAPSALCYSKLMYPETEKVTVTKENIREIKLKFDSVLDAAVKGAGEAGMIVISICSNLIAFIAMVYFINGVLGWLGTLVGFVEEGEIWSLELVLGKILIPLAYTMGVEWEDCEKVGQLIGIKTIVNEFVAFQKMQKMTLSPRSRVIATYSICGFSNPGSIGSMLSVMCAFMPNKQENLLRLVFRAFVGGAFVCLMTACIAGLLTPL